MAAVEAPLAVDMPRPMELQMTDRGQRTSRCGRARPVATSRLPCGDIGLACGSLAVALRLGDGDDAARVAGQVACPRVQRRERRREGEKSR